MTLTYRPHDVTLDEDRFRRSYLYAMPAGDNQMLVVRNDGSRALVTRPELELIVGCARFATLEEHASTLSSRRDRSTESPEILRQRLAELATRGLLDRASLVARGGPPQKDTPQTIRTVTIPTRARPDAVVRAVRNVAEVAKRTDRQIDCLLINDSAKDLVLPAFDDVCALVIGRRERERLAQILASESGVPSELVRYALLGDPLHRWRVGAARNTALLLTVGQTSMSIDDDVILRLTASPELQPGARATSAYDPTAFWFFPDRATALATQPAQIDPFETVEQALGRPASALLDGGPDATWLDDVAPPLAATLAAGRAQIAATSFGAVGDSGMGGVGYYLHLRGDTLRRAASDDATWEWVRRTRAVLRATDRVVLSGGSHFMSMAIGLDHRGFLPPFPPTGRGADQQFCEFLRHCADDALIAHLPWAVFHDPPEERSAPRPGSGLLSLMEPVGWVMQLHSTGFSVLPEDRLIALGTALEKHGRLPPSAFDEFVRLWFCRKRGGEIASLELELASAPAAAFARDVRCAISALRGTLLDDPTPVPVEVTGHTTSETIAAMQDYLVRLGELLMVWPTLVAAARRLPLPQMLFSSNPRAASGRLPVWDQKARRTP
jgi:hypothetical protein